MTDIEGFHYEALNSQILRRPRDDIQFCGRLQTYDDRQPQNTVIPRPPRDLVFNALYKSRLPGNGLPECPTENTGSLGGLGMTDIEGFHYEALNSQILRRPQDDIQYGGRLQTSDDNVL